jgi:hypothetical protein
MHIELLWKSRIRSFKNRRVGVGVGAFVYQLHSPDCRIENLWYKKLSYAPQDKCKLRMFN